MRSSDTYHVQQKTTGKKDREIEKELIMTILDKINNVKIAANKQVEKSDELMKSTELELRDTISSRRRLFNQLKNCFDTVKDLLGMHVVNYPRFRQLRDPALTKRDLGYLCTKDEMVHKGHWPTNQELLTRISNELDEIKEYTTGPYVSQFPESLESVKTEMKKHRNGLEDMEGYVEQEFSKVKDLIEKHYETCREDKSIEDESAEVDKSEKDESVEDKF